MLLSHVFQGQAGAVFTDVSAQETHLTAGLSTPRLPASWDSDQPGDLRKVTKAISVHWWADQQVVKADGTEFLQRIVILCRSTNPVFYFQVKLLSKTIPSFILFTF